MLKGAAMGDSMLGWLNYSTNWYVFSKLPVERIMYALRTPDNNQVSTSSGYTLSVMFIGSGDQMDWVSYFGVWIRPYWLAAQIPES